jgi:tartrate/fumarate subfamily iron-sulfur-dependent hydro-lyase alpha chain
MVDPLDRSNPGENLGRGMPRVKVRFDDSVSGLDVVAAPKGGGSEIFGTFYRMLYPSDGVQGIKKFVLESVRDGCYAGKICPPAIVGVGVGGTADLCMELAKEAALLRPLGSTNPRPEIETLEADLLSACRGLGVGPMGSRGVNSVMGMHVECAVTHTAALPVAVNAQCLIGRRWRVRVGCDGGFELTGDVTGWYTRE